MVWCGFGHDHYFRPKDPVGPLHQAVMAEVIAEGGAASDYSSDGVEVLDLTATPTPHARAARVCRPTSPSAPSDSSRSSVSPPPGAAAAAAACTTQNTADRRQEEAPGFELTNGFSSSDDDFDMRPGRPAASDGTSNNNNNKRQGKAAAITGSASSSSSGGPARSAKPAARSIPASASSSVVVADGSRGGNTGKGSNGFAADCVALGGERGGVVELLSDSDDGGKLELQGSRACWWLAVRVRMVFRASRGSMLSRTAQGLQQNPELQKRLCVLLYNTVGSSLRFFKFKFCGLTSIVRSCNKYWD